MASVGIDQVYTGCPLCTWVVCTLINVDLTVLPLVPILADALVGVVHLQACSIVLTWVCQTFIDVSLAVDSVEPNSTFTSDINVYNFSVHTKLKCLIPKPIDKIMACCTILAKALFTIIHIDLTCNSNVAIHTDTLVAVNKI